LVARSLLDGKAYTAITRPLRSPNRHHGGEAPPGSGAMTAPQTSTGKSRPKPAVTAAAPAKPPCGLDTPGCDPRAALNPPACTRHSHGAFGYLSSS
jgi:hypothetical protein